MECNNVSISIDNFPAAIAVVDMLGNITKINTSFSKILGYDQTIIGKPIETLIPQESHNRHVRYREKYSQNQVSKNMGAGLAIFALHKNQTKIPVKIHLEPIIIDGNHLIICCISDITQLHESEEMLKTLNNQLEIKVLQRTQELYLANEQKNVSETLFKEHRELYESIIDAATDGWWDWKVGTNNIYLSPKLKETFGYQDEEVTNTLDNLIKIMHPDDVDMVLKAADDHVKKQIPFSLDIRYICKNSNIKWVLCRGKAIQDKDGVFRRMIGAHTNITHQKNIELKLKKLAHYDPVTKLPNRTNFQDEIFKSIKWHTRFNRKFSLLFIDLDNFKDINDELGHSIGDIFLKRIGRNIKQSIREIDFIARLGGDEFVVLLHNLRSFEEVTNITQRILQSFNDPIQFNGYSRISSASIGIAVFPTDGQNVSTLMKHADAAMYSAKSKGKNTFCIFTELLDNKK